MDIESYIYGYKTLYLWIEKVTSMDIKRYIYG